MNLLTTRYSKLVRDLQAQLEIYNPLREIEFMLQSLDFIAGPGITINQVGGTVTVSATPPSSGSSSSGVIAEESYTRIFLTMGA